MCDYSLAHLASRPAVVGEKLVTRKGNGNYGTTGLFSPEDANATTAVCVLPGTELVFKNKAVKVASPWDRIKAVFGVVPNTDKVAVFCQINKEQRIVHHDAVKFADDSVVLLNDLELGQIITVLQLPAAAKTPGEAKAQERLPMAENVYG